MFKNLKLKIRSFFGNWKLKIGNSPRGVSMPLATGLVTLLMISSMAANELIIKSLLSVRGIEASNRAYFAAEAGVEDALYELSAHTAGYQTPVIDNVTGNDRKGTFNTNKQWNNRWDIQSRSGLLQWDGKFYKNQKLVLPLYHDIDNITPTGENAISGEPAEITNLKPVGLSVKFKIPNANSFINPMDLFLKINNDQDDDVNEDQPGVQNKNCENPEDNDCDGKADEDWETDPVILWKLTDSEGGSLIPKPGCISDLAGGSELCEKDFSTPNFEVTLSDSQEGQRENGEIETIAKFIIDSGLDSRVQLELLIIAPMEYFDKNTNPATKIEIPYISYAVQSNESQLPYPYFTIKSDGYYINFKQSITTTLTPKTTVPLFDFTIIEQQ